MSLVIHGGSDFGRRRSSFMDTSREDEDLGDNVRIPVPHSPDTSVVHVPGGETETVGLCEWGHTR